MEIANLNVYVQKGAIGKTLRVAFGGVIERAEVLASMLRAWRTAAEARPGDEGVVCDVVLRPALRRRPPGVQEGSRGVCGEGEGEGYSSG